jgi:hypothetical protein
MGQRQKPGEIRESAEERAMRDKEVVRANRELAAYFRGQRTDREARAALKTIKAYIREREHQDPRNRPPLPGAAPVGPSRRSSSGERSKPKGKDRRGPRATRTKPAAAETAAAPEHPGAEPTPQNAE